MFRYTYVTFNFDVELEHVEVGNMFVRGVDYGDNVCRLIVLFSRASEKSLQMAKRNIARYYPVVGLTEDLYSTFGLLEWELPRYFKGAADIYKGRGR